MLKRIALLLPLLLLCSFPILAQQGRQLVQENSPTRRLALVIGNGAYVNAPHLKNPPNDATDMAEALSQLGFTVEHGVDLTQKQMKFMIREFGKKLRGGGQGLFYFAGHGVQLKGRNYLIPVDADIQSETDVEDQGVDANLVLGLMDEASNGLNIVILDACRNNPFARSFRSASSGLAQMDAPTGTLIAYATAPGSVASDGNSRNGLYTQELLKFVRTPNLSIEEVFKRVRISVRNLTQGKQTPWEASSLTGDFYFVREGATVAAASPQTASTLTDSPALAPPTAAKDSSTNGNIVIPLGEKLRVELLSSLSTDVSQPGDRFEARVVESRKYEGAIITGRVERVRRAGNLHKAELWLSFEQIRLLDGRQGNFTAQVTEVLQANEYETGSAISQKGRNQKKEIRLPQGQQLVISTLSNTIIQ